MRNSKFVRLDQSRSFFMKKPGKKLNFMEVITNAADLKTKKNNKLKGNYFFYRK